MPSTTVSRRAVLRTLSSGVAAGLGGCGAVPRASDPEPLPDATPGADDWPASGYGPRNRRYNPAASPARSEPGVRWTRDFRYCHAPVVRGSRVVANAEDATVGLRATDGGVVWRSDAEPWGYERPTLGAERAYVTGTDCALGFDLEGGERTWRGRPCHGANTNSGTIARGRIYLAYGGYFSALDASGRVTWASRHDVQGSPAVAGRTAYVATAFTAEAVDLTASAREWPWEDRDDDEPAHATRDAATEWSEPPRVRSTRRVHLSPAVAGATVYVTVERPGRPGGELRALARDAGEERWSIASPPASVPGEGRPEAPDPVGRPTAPVVTEELVVTALGDRQLLALSHGGEPRWTRPLDRAVTEVVGAGETILALSHDRSAAGTAAGHARLTAFDLATGAPRWRRDFQDHASGLAVAGGTIYLTAVTGRSADGDVTGERLLALG